MTNPMTPTAGELAARRIQGIANNCAGEPDDTVLYNHQCIMGDIPLTIGDAKALAAALTPTQDGPSAEVVEQVARALAESHGLRKGVHAEVLKPWMRDAKTAIQAMPPTASTVNKAMLEALRPFEREFRDVGLGDHLAGDKLMLDVDCGGEILTVQDWRNLMAAIALARGDA